jgi:BRCA1-associated protein
LTSNQDAYQTKLSLLEDNFKKLNLEKDKEIEELKSQLRDIMFYLDAQNKMSESTISKEELQDSKLIIQQDSSNEATLGATGVSKSSGRRRNKK